MTCAAIFDLDGTLIDSLGDIARLMNASLEQAGLPPHPVSAYQGFVGSGMTVLAERATKGLDADVAALVKDFRARYRDEPVGGTRPYEGIREMLAELARLEVKLAVLSNKPHALTVAIVEQLMGDVPFVEIWGHKDTYPRKPDPKSARVVAERLAVPPSDCAFIGDTEIDMQVAKRAGMRPLGVAWGFRPEAELIASGADIVVNEPAALVPLIVGSSAS